MIEDDSDDLDIYWFVGVPIVLVLLLLIIGIIAFRCCRKRKNIYGDEEQSLLSSEFLGSTPTYNNMRMGSIVPTEDINLIERVNNQKRKQIKESREAAYVYLQFFIRSNPMLAFRTIEHLPSVGHQQSDRNWFLIKQAFIDNNVEKHKLKLLTINIFDKKSNQMKQKLCDIADSMSLNLKQTELLLNDIFLSIKHPHVLTYDRVDVNFEKDRVLFIQDYSKDGSLKDLIRGTNPNDDWEFKCKHQSVKHLPVKSMKDYGKQILSALIYFKEKKLFPFYSVHAGNVILAYKRKMCLLTGYENTIFVPKCRSLQWGERHAQKIIRTYRINESAFGFEEQLTNDVEGEVAAAAAQSSNRIRKAVDDYELKRMMEVLKFGHLIIEMCTGQMIDDLQPQQDIIRSIEQTYEFREASEIVRLLNFIFFNNEKLKKDETNATKRKFLLPDLRSIYNHEFFDSVKQKEHPVEPFDNVKQLEMLKYLNGKLEIKVKKLKRSGSNSNRRESVTFTSKTLSTINEASSSSMSKGAVEETDAFSNFNRPTMQTSSSQISRPPPAATSTSTAAPAPPPPPPAPAPSMSKAPPPPPPAAAALPEEADDRTALLGDIRKGMKLKKTVTNDRSKPFV